MPRRLTIIITLSLLLATATLSNAQTTADWETYLAELTVDEDVDEESWAEAFDLMANLVANPMNINTATRDDWERISFLTQPQIEELCEYLDKYGPMRSLGELAMLESLDPTRRRLLTCMVYVGEDDNEQRRFPTLHNILKYGKQQLLATAKIPFYERKGDKEGYLGYPYRHTLRYDFGYGEYVKAGIVGAQDAGEPFFAGKNNCGYDFYSFYLVMRHIGRLKTLALGRYRVNLGMGLIMNTDFNLGKVATLQQLSRTSGIIRGHSSRQEANYLQGAAATYVLAPGLEATAFLSYRPIDATLTNDSMGIATVITTGYHRTTNEMEKKHNSSQTLAGGHINYRQGRLHGGVSALYTRYDRPLRPTMTQAYRQIYPTGNDFWNLSADYGYTSRRLNINGETATSGSGAIATINSLSLAVGDQLDLMLLQRFYAYRYHALFGRSLSESGKVQNESGFYAGINWRPMRDLTLTAYSDYAYFAWPRYGISEASHAWDNLLSINYQKRAWNASLRYRVKLRQKDNDDKTGLTSYATHRMRATVGLTGTAWSTKTQADLTWCDGEHGWMLSQTVNLKLQRARLYATLGYFSTDGFDSRIYVYERGMLYAFSYPSYYGEGIRYALMGTTDIGKSLMLTAKVGITDYMDRNSIGSGLQTIDHSSKTDAEVQLRWKF